VRLHSIITQQTTFKRYAIVKTSTTAVLFDCMWIFLFPKLKIELKVSHNSYEYSESCNVSTEDVFRKWFPAIVSEMGYMLDCVWFKASSKLFLIIQWNLYKAEPHGTENIFHIGQISALYKINNTDSCGWDYRICSHWANFRLIQVLPYTSFTVVCLFICHTSTRKQGAIFVC
jgi:hypothetical protein